MHGKLTWLAIALFIVAVSAVVWARGLLPMSKSNPAPERPVSDRATPESAPSEPSPAGSQKATFGGGCFWCTEAVFQQLKGVHSVVSGYSGGSVKNPTYEQDCLGRTGHAEVIQVTYDPAVISFPDLLEVFWKTHDPTTLNRQGPDHGTQYRSVIFYHDKEQQELAEQYRQKLNASGAFEAPIVTEISPFSEFYPAEAYHQNYYLDHPREGYCAMMIVPKLEKFKKVFKDKLKPPSP